MHKKRRGGVTFRGGYRVNVKAHTRESPHGKGKKKPRKGKKGKKGTRKSPRKGRGTYPSKRLAITYQK